MPPPLLVSFAAGASGNWLVDGIEKVVGESLPMADRVEVSEGEQLPTTVDKRWILHGPTGNARYASQDSEAFEELVRRLRHTEEWRYVEREVDIRLSRVWIAIHKQDASPQRQRAQNNSFRSRRFDQYGVQPRLQSRRIIAKSARQQTCTRFISRTNATAPCAGRRRRPCRWRADRSRPRSGRAPG
jgi:hypothetical protein